MVFQAVRLDNQEIPQQQILFHNFHHQIQDNFHRAQGHVHQL